MRGIADVVSFGSAVFLTGFISGVPYLDTCLLLAAIVDDLDDNKSSVSKCNPRRLQSVNIRTSGMHYVVDSFPASVV